MKTAHKKNNNIKKNAKFEFVNQNFKFYTTTHKRYTQKKLIDFTLLHNIKNLNTNFIILKISKKQQCRHKNFEKIQNFDIKITRNNNFI